MTSDSSDHDRRFKLLDIEKREEEIRQLKSRNKLSWMAPATILAIVPLLGGLGAWIHGEITKYNDGYQALGRVDELQKESDRLKREKSETRRGYS